MKNKTLAKRGNKKKWKISMLYEKWVSESHERRGNWEGKGQIKRKKLNDIKGHIVKRQ